MITKERLLFLKKIIKKEDDIIKDAKTKNKVKKTIGKVCLFLLLIFVGVIFHSMSIGGLSVNAYVFLSVLFFFMNVIFVIGYNELIVKTRILKKIKNKEIIDFIDFYKVNDSCFLKIDELRNQLSKEEKGVLLGYYRNLKNWDSAIYVYFNSYIENEPHSVLEGNKMEMLKIIKNELSSEKTILCLFTKLNEKINEEVPKQIEEMELKILKKEKSTLNINTI